ncbi:MAG: protein kinase [Gemmatimonadota bacterium]
MASRTPSRAGVIKLRLTLGVKVFTLTALVVVVVLGGALLITKVVADRAADSSIDRALAATESSIQNALASRSHALLRVTETLAQVPSYVSRVSENILAGNRSDLVDAANEFQKQTGAEWAMITDERGVLQAWTLNLNQFGDNLAEGALIGLALEGNSTEGLWIEPTPEGEKLYQAVGTPILSPGIDSRTVKGVLVTAVPIDSAFAAQIRGNTNSEVVFFARDSTGRPHSAVSTLPRAQVDSAIMTINPDSAFKEPDSTGATSDSAAPQVRVRMSANGQAWVGSVGELRTASGYPIGGYIGFRSRDVELAPYTRLRQVVIGAFVAGLLLTVLSSLFIARQITGPVKRLVELTGQIAEGQYSGVIDIHSGDEIGQLADAFRRMMFELKEKDRVVEYLSAVSGQTLPLLTASGATTSGAVPSPSMLLPVGMVLANRYEIKEVLGAGGMGVVYRALDRQLHEIVAVKTLKSQLLHFDQNVIERFKQEIRLARRITHRNVVRTHDLGEVDGTYFITMEYVEGTSLEKLIHRRGRLPVDVTLPIGKQLCRALEVAHEAGVIHRDIKPQNMVVDASGFLKVMDFGIARLAEAQPRLDKSKGLTQAGSVLGTPDYMSPEQLMGDELDVRSDLYAAGAVLFECMTGESVFTAPTLMALMAMHIESEPRDPRSINPEIPESLSRVILKALAKRRDDRWPSAAAMHFALDQVTR